MKFAIFLTKRSVWKIWGFQTKFSFDFLETGFKILFLIFMIKKL